jgi:3-oxoacyl-[acyl-carrier protein] reductase
VSSDPARSTWSAVVVGGRATARSPAARVVDELRLRRIEVESVSRPDQDEVAAGCADAARRAPLRAVVHAHVPAGLTVPTPLVDLDDSAWTRIVDESVLATLTTLQAARRHMDRGGTVLVVVPAVGLVGEVGHVALAAAGEAQRALAKSAARAWRSAGISVNVVATEPVELAPPGDAAVLDPDDGLADAAMLLLSANARRTTGVTLVADGGTTMLP